MSCRKPVRLAANKTPAQIESEWDAIAELRHDQIVTGRDISYTEVMVPMVEDLISTASMSRVLDVGCGTGELTERLSRRGGDAIGVDVSAKSILIAQQVNPRKRNLTYLHSSIEDFVAHTDGEKFSLVVASMTLMTSPNQRTVWESAAKLLQPGGVFVATLTHPCFWPIYWGYFDAVWFNYSAELVIEAPFRISKETSSLTTTHVHRPLSDYLIAASEAGLSIETLAEPIPTEAVQRKYPVPWGFPRFLGIRARKV